MPLLVRAYRDMPMTSANEELPLFGGRADESIGRWDDEPYTPSTPRSDQRCVRGIIDRAAASKRRSQHPSQTPVSCGAGWKSAATGELRSRSRALAHLHRDVALYSTRPRDRLLNVEQDSRVRAWKLSREHSSRVAPSTVIEASLLSSTAHGRVMESGSSGLSLAVAKPYGVSLRTKIHKGIKYEPVLQRCGDSSLVTLVTHLTFHRVRDCELDISRYWNRHTSIDTFCPRGYIGSSARRRGFS
jgi:hypothetical protein